MIVISNGMLRSGSTLQYNLAASVLETAGPLERAGFLGDFVQPDSRAKLEAMKASNGWTILKTHEAPLERDFYDERVVVLFSYRDVRDIAASIKKKWGYPFEQIVSDIAAMIEIEEAFGHVPNVHVQSYEKLFDTPQLAVVELAKALGQNLDDYIIHSIADENSVATKEGEKSKDGFVSRIASRIFPKGYDQKSLLHPDHISKTGGKGGDWVNQFTDKELETLNNRFGDWLQKHNYL